jgi:hypothetical protein
MIAGRSPRKPAFFYLAVRSEPPQQHKYDNDDQNRAEGSDAGVTEAVTVTPEAATETAEQENDEDDNEDGSN